MYFGLPQFVVSVEVKYCIALLTFKYYEAYV